MVPSELATSITRIFVARDPSARVSISDDWALSVEGAGCSVTVRLSPAERTPDAAVAAVRAAGQWGWAVAAPLTASGTRESSAARYEERTTVVTFAEAPLDEASRDAIRDAILEELAQAAEEMRAHVRGSSNGWWTVRLTRTSDRLSQAGVVSAPTEQPGTLRKLTRSLMASLGRQRR